MPEIKIEIENLTDLDKAAAAILEKSAGNKVFALYGEMGSGKTTLIQSLCKLLGVTSVVTSPTFSIVNEYHTSGNNVVYHFDFYRIKNISEAYDLGYESYFFSGHYCFIEWPDKVEALMHFPHVKLNITVVDKKRIVILHA